MKTVILSKEELQILVDGLEDTKSKILDGSAFPTTERYNFLVISLRKRLEKLILQ